MYHSYMIDCFKREPFRMRQILFLIALIALAGCSCPASGWQVNPQTGFPQGPLVTGAAAPVSASNSGIAKSGKTP
jgi:hypothetical protein